MQLATLCYIFKDDEILMLHRTKKAQDIHKGKWNGLGGKFEAGETPEQCVIREVLEESGLRLIAPQMRGFLTFPKFAKGRDWYVFLFTAEEFNGELATSAEGDLKWINKSDLFELNLWEGDKIFLPYLFRDGFFSGRFNYEEGSLVSHEIVVHSQRSKNQ